MKIAYKIGTALLALAIFPVMIFAPFVKLIVTTDIASFLSSETQVLIDESYSLKSLYELYAANKDMLADSGFSLSSIPENVVHALRIPAIAFLVLFALAILCAVLIVFFGLFAKNKRVPVVLAILGAASCFGMNIAFNNFAKPLINGTITITDILGQEFVSKISGGMATLGEALMSLFGAGSQLLNVKLFCLGGAYVFMILLFVAVILWAVAYTFMEWDKQ